MSDKTCFIIPTEELSLSDVQRRRMEAASYGKNRAATKWLQSVDNLTARDGQYVTDLIANANLPVVAGIAGWLSMPLGAIGAWVSLLRNGTPAAVTATPPTDQLWVFYGAAVLDAAIGPFAVSALEFREGSAANLKYRFNLENLDGKTVLDGFFSQIVTYENPQVVTINIQTRLALAVPYRVALKFLVIETMDSTVT
jgi:hypothetical protein